MRPGHPPPPGFHWAISSAVVLLILQRKHILGMPASSDLFDLYGWWFGIFEPTQVAIAFVVGLPASLLLIAARRAVRATDEDAEVRQ